MTESERSPLILLSSSSSPPLATKHAKGIWSFGTEGTRIYLLILLSACFVAASDPPFKASLTTLYQEFLCCQHEPTKCHNRDWCHSGAAVPSERELSTLFQWQSTFNAAGSAASICIWYWRVWPWVQRDLPQGEKDMTRPLILSQTGIFLLEIVNAVVAYAALNNIISITKFRYLVIFAPTVSFLIGGGPATYWAFRENIIAAAVVKAPTTAETIDGPENDGVQRKPLHLENRQTAYILLSVSAACSQLLSGQLNRWFISTRSASNHTPLWSLVVGLVSYAIGIAFLLQLPSVPLPTPSISTPKVLDDANNDQRLQTQKQPSTSYTTRITRDRLITALVLLSGMASRPLASSVSSNFAIMYISRRLHFDTSNAVVLTNSANIIPPLLPVIGPYLFSAMRNICRRLNINIGTYVPLSAPYNHQPTSSTDKSPASAPTRVRLSNIFWALAFLATAMVGTVMMSVSSGTNLSRNYYFVLVAIIFICVGTSYLLFTEPILAGWSAEGKKPSVFVFQQMINAAFMMLGAYLLNLGFQRETDDGQQPDGPQFGWTYLAITGVCVVAGCFLLAAVWLSPGARRDTLEEEGTEGDTTPVQR